MTDQPDPAAAILAVVETAIGDQLTDSARAEALDGIRRALDPAVAAPATADDGLRATPAEAAVNRVRSWIAGEPVTARSGFGDGYREALRDVLDVIDRKGADRA